ncbi:MAG: 5-formyltetrahydrofolate cyclo-ligase [Spirochaetales bacterium]|nr:5-formyltetrahydrofolate cyclo-ligase [Spirochaetales bacterium]
MDKIALRRSLKQIKTSAESSKIITSKLLSLDEIKRASNLLLYYPLDDEPDIKALYNCGKTIYLPVIEKDNMHFRKYNGSLKIGRFGIKEPTGEYYQDDKSTIIVVPAVAYDNEGYRLGRGKGFYDRFLSKHKIKSIGVITKKRVISDVAKEANDIKVDTLITD